jgi:hypothetical protein
LMGESALRPVRFLAGGGQQVALQQAPRSTGCPVEGLCRLASMMSRIGPTFGPESIRPLQVCNIRSHRACLLQPVYRAPTGLRPLIRLPTGRSGN